MSPSVAQHRQEELQRAHLRRQLAELPAETYERSIAIEEADARRGELPAPGTLTRISGEDATTLVGPYTPQSTAAAVWSVTTQVGKLYVAGHELPNPSAKWPEAGALVQLGPTEWLEGLYEGAQRKPLCIAFADDCEGLVHVRELATALPDVALVIYSTEAVDEVPISERTWGTL